MTVRELLSRIDAHELAEWMAYYSIDPFGTARADLSAGIIAATVANANKGKKGRPFQPADFMPYTEKIEQTESDMIQILNSMVKKGN